MEVPFEASLSGSEVVDALKGARNSVSTLPIPELRVAKIQKVMSLLPMDTFYCHTFDVSAVRALVETHQRPSDYRDHLTDVQFLGRVDEPGNVFSYLVEEDVPLDDIVVTFNDPVVIGYDVAAQLGYSDFRLQVPLLDIMACVDIRQAV